MRLFSIVMMFILLTTHHNEVRANLLNPDSSPACTNNDTTLDRTCIITKDTLCPYDQGTEPAGNNITACLQFELFNWDVINSQTNVTKKLRFEIAPNIDNNGNAIPYNMIEPIFLFDRRNIEIIGSSRDLVSISPDDDWLVSLGLDHYSMVTIIDSSNIIIEGINFDGYSKNIFRDDENPTTFYQTTKRYLGVDGIRVCATPEAQIKNITIRRISSEHIPRWFFNVGGIYVHHLWNLNSGAKFGGLSVNINYDPNNIANDVFRLQKNFVDYVNRDIFPKDINKRSDNSGNKFGCTGYIHNITFEENDLDLIGNAFYMYPPSSIFTENDSEINEETWRGKADDFASRYTGFIIRNNHFRVWDWETDEPAELPVDDIPNYQGHAINNFHSFIKVHYAKGMVIEGNRFDASKADPEKTKRRSPTDGNIVDFHVFSNGAMLNLASGMIDTIVQGNYFEFPVEWRVDRQRHGIALKGGYSQHDFYGLGPDRVFGITRGTVVTGNRFDNSHTFISDITQNTSELEPYETYDRTSSNYSLWIDEYPVFEANVFNGNEQDQLLYKNYLERQSVAQTNIGLPQFLIREYPQYDSLLWDQKIIPLNDSSPVYSWFDFDDLTSIDTTQLNGNFNGDINGVMDLCISRFTSINGWHLSCTMGNSNNREYDELTNHNIGGGNWTTQGFRPIVLDFNTDGKDDLCSVQLLTDGSYWRTLCAPSYGNGTFGGLQSSDWSEGLDYYSNNATVVVGQIDNTPGEDICISDQTSNNGWQLTCVGSVGNGHFSTAVKTSIGSGDYSDRELIPGDYNNDGYLDLCAVQLGEETIQSHCILGDGSRGFGKLKIDDLTGVVNGGQIDIWKQFNDNHSNNYADSSMIWSDGSTDTTPARNYVGNDADDLCFSRKDEHGWILYCAESTGFGQFNTLAPHHYRGSNWQDLDLTIISGKFNDDNYADICAVQTHQLLGVRPFCAASYGNGSFGGLAGRFRSVILNANFAVGKTSIGNKERLVLGSLNANNWLVIDLGDLF